MNWNSTRGAPNPLRGPRHLLASLSIASAVVVAGALPAQAAPARTTADLSLRAGPSTSYERLTVMPQGVTVDVERCTPGYGWCQLDYNGYEGWASARYLNLSRQDVDEPIANVRIDLGIPIFDFFAGIGAGAPDDDEDTGPQVARNEVCFYADFDYGGDSFCATRGEADERLSEGWNDRISSIRTGSNTGVFVCEHYDFNGNCRRITGEVASLSGNWNDIVSSFEVGRGPSGGDGGNGGGNGGDTAGPGPGEICFYRDFEFRGESFCVAMGDRDRRMGGNRNDAISSIRVGAGSSVEVCEDFGFGGSCRTVTRDIASLPSNWNDVISSYRTTGSGDGGDGDGDQANRVCFFADYNYRGNSFCVEAGEQDRRVTGQWNDTISSIRVGSNAQLQVCEDFGFSGQCRTLNQDVSSLQGDWNDTISSYRTR